MVKKRKASEMQFYKPSEDKNRSSKIKQITDFFGIPSYMGELAMSEAELQNDEISIKIRQLKKQLGVK